MKTIIAGSRDIADMFLLMKAIQLSQFNISEVVCGMATGMDTIGERWALYNDIPVIYFPADWNTLGKRAGYVRNKEMAKYGEGLIAIWNGVSKGTKHMIDLAVEYKLKTFVWNLLEHRGYLL